MAPNADGGGPGRCPGRDAARGTEEGAHGAPRLGDAGRQRRDRALTDR